MDSQEKFENMISSGKTIRGKKCFIDIPLSGDINLSTLKHQDIDELHFMEGDISWFYNVPRGIKKIVINDNKLENIPSLELGNLVSLEANNNRLSKIDLKEMTKIASLYLNNNKIHNILNFPSSLQILNIDRNNLSELDMHGGESCTSVSCVDNPRLNKIYNAPVSKHYFELNKDSHAQIMLHGGTQGSSSKQYSSSTQGSTQKSEEAIFNSNFSSNSQEVPNLDSLSFNSEIKIMYSDVKEAVNEYYALKNRYTEEQKTVINKIMNKKSMSRKDKIQEVRNAVYNCINCKRKGGTKFWKESNYNLKAVCGNVQNPCKLDIEILASLTVSERELNSEKQDIEDAKLKIIQLKLNTLFGYITEQQSIREFDNNLKIIKSERTNNILNNEKYSYYNIQNNPDKKRLILKKMEIVYSELADIRKIMEEYNIMKNEKLLNDAVLKHQVIKSNINIIRALKYPINEIVDENSENVLKQYPFSFDDYLNPNMELLKVIKYSL